MPSPLEEKPVLLTAESSLQFSDVLNLMKGFKSRLEKQNNTLLVKRRSRRQNNRKHPANIYKDIINENNSEKKIRDSLNMEAASSLQS